MKKILIVLALMMSLSGCTRNPTDNNDNNNNNTPNTNETMPNDTVPGTSNPNGNMPNSNNNTSWYDQFETGLRDNNFNYTAKTSLDPSSIGGTEGYRYMGTSGYVDVYRFDEGEKLNKIKKDKKMKIDGEEKQVEVNGNWVIVNDSLSEDVLNMFRGLK